EKLKDRTQTIQFIDKLSLKYNAKFNIHYFMPLPGTPFEGLAPEPIENAVKESVHRLIRDGIAHGDFFHQLHYTG
ncbi:MAG: B12-binding domain-containing radical SAM protein, partial [Elusimicrobiota bacterium]